jgi:uncharacterized RDD family membrane protein YckC
MSGDTNVIWRRGIAHVVDGFLPVVVALLIAAAAGDDSGGIFFALWAGLTLFQFLILQGLTGWTPGKWLTGIRVVDERGGPPGIVRAVKRSVPLLFEWTTLIALVAIWRDPYGQRIGDRWAGTYVVRASRRSAGSARSSEVTA